MCRCFCVVKNKEILGVIKMQNQKQQNQGEIIFVSFTFQHNNKQIYIDVDENCTLDRAFEELCKKYK